MKTRRKPNILWISFEDTHPFYGCYGDPVARTPNLDRLAGEGCLWRHAFSTAAVCAPARSAIITGMYATSIGTHHMRTTHENPFAPELPTPYATVVPHYVKCFTEYLRAAGYFCTNNVKTDYQFEPPVTAWDECGPAAHWRNRPDAGQPFFSVFNFEDTHESGMWAVKPLDLTVDPASIRIPPYLPDTPKVRESMARMYTRIEHNDRRLGRLLEELARDGLAENTIVFHWSDHGPLPRGKRWPYDSGIRVPLIVRWPNGLEPGTVDDRLVSTLDLGPTVLSLAGVPAPRHLQGQAFLGPEAAPPRKYVFATRDRHDVTYDMVRAVRDHRFKYIRNYYPNNPFTDWVPYLNQHPIMQELWRLHRTGGLDEIQQRLFQPQRPVEELYDTLVDPHEVHNLADNPEFEPELARLREALDEWRRETGDLGDLGEAEMVQSWLCGGQPPVTAAPLMIPYDAAHSGDKPATEDGIYEAPLLLQLHCVTQGASIAYQLGPGDSTHWRLYTGPLRLDAGSTTVRAKAVRIGYRESRETAFTFDVRPPATAAGGLHAHAQGVRTIS